MWTSALGSSRSTVPRSSVAKWPDIGATISSFGPPSIPARRKRLSRPNGRDSTISSVTATSRPSITVRSSPNAGLPRGAAACANTSSALAVTAPPPR